MGTGDAIAGERKKDGMMIRAALIGFLSLSAPATATPVFLQLKAPLDTPTHYCIDLKGHDASVDLDAPLQAHSCKEGYPQTDQQVDDADARKGQLRMPAYGRCLTSIGDTIVTRPCTGAATQRWAWSKDSTLRAADKRCLTAGADSRSAGVPKGVTWAMRDLRLEACSQAAASRQQWVLQKAKLPIR